MAEWWFYHLMQPPLAAALASLFEKCLERNWRVLVVSPDMDTLKQVNKDLWTYRDDSFLPHDLPGLHDDNQPVLLTGSAENVNGASVLALLNGQSHAPDAKFERVMVVFEDGDEFARGVAREQYRAAKAAALTVRYFQQTANGGWKEN